MIRAIPEDKAKTKRRGRAAGIRAGGNSAQSLSRARTRRRWLTLVLGIGLIVECAAGALTSPYFYIREVEVAGTGGIGAREARETLAAVNVPQESGIMRLNAGALKSRLEGLPWIERADVARSLPGTVTVSITPRKPFAVVLIDDRHWQVDRAGIPIRRARAGAHLPLIQMASTADVTAGQTIIDDSFEDALGVALSCERLQSSPIEKITVDSQAHICLNMSDGIVVRLGPSEEMEAKLALIEKIYREQPDIAARVETIDLTAPENPACRPLTESRTAERAKADSRSVNHPSAVEGGSRSD